MLGLSPFLIASLVGGVVCFIASLAKPATGLHLLVITIVFGGIVSLNVSDGGSNAILFRDIAIVLPLYISIFFLGAGRHAVALIPAPLLICLSLFLFIVAVCALSFAAESPMLQTLIGIKVWLFYVPFLVIGLAIGAAPAVRVRLFRQILFWGTVSATVGLVQALLVRVIGYSTAIGLFFGANAGMATQNYAFFEAAGGIYRIPGTFSFVTQYSGFLYAYMTVAVIVANTDPHPKVKYLARAAIFIAATAALLSGVRAAVLIIPSMLALYAYRGLLTSRLIVIAPVGILVAMAALSFSGLDLFSYFGVGRELAVSYGNDFVFQQISDSLDSGMLGRGIGTSTGAARYALENPNQMSLNGFESYFAKSAAELGTVGLLVIALLFAVVTSRVVAAYFGSRDRDRAPIVVPLAVYIGTNVILSFKAFVLDTDPGNIFFWLFLGIMIASADRVTSTIRRGEAWVAANFARQSS